LKIVSRRKKKKKKKKKKLKRVSIDVSITTNVLCFVED
jgi:hypothetical protein